MFHPIWRLSAGGADNFGLACNEEGLFLGRTPLIERRNERFVARDARDIQRLLSRAYRTEVDATSLMGGLATVAAALNANDLLLARIAAVHLRIPDLPDQAARDALETEDRLIKEVGGRFVAKSGDWDPAQHPRLGTAPNPGWFAPADGSSEESSGSAAARSAAYGVEVASADESMRPGQKPDLPTGGGGGGFSGGRPVPVQQSGAQSLDGILAPGGRPVGVVSGGTRATVRTVTPAEFDAIRSDLLSDAVPVSGPKGYPGQVFERPDGSLVGIRNSRTGRTIDVIKSANPRIDNGFRIHQR